MCAYSLEKRSSFLQGILLVFFHKCPRLIPFSGIGISFLYLFYVVFESTLLNIYSNFLRRCLFNSSCESEFHIHGVICMIVRHKENVLGSATYSDFHVSY